MVKQKDPAFLFYSKDWIEGTAELMPDEKGVFIDLLAHQHQKGSVPADERRLARMVGLPLEDFIRIWRVIKTKFTEYDTPNATPNGVPNASPFGDRLVNRKLQERSTERSHRSKKNTIIGTFAHVLKKLDISKKERDLLRKNFNIDEILAISTESPTMSVTESVTEWCHRCQENGVPIIENANANNNKEDISKKIANIDERISRFEKEVKESALDKYPTKMVEEFIRYWTQKNRSGKKFKAEDQTFFEIPKRLVTWYDKSDFSKKKSSAKKDSSFN